ncbi:rhomboid family intramembrane serine protease [Mucilaginibacter sp.]|uniref:rhomboid family intramembrane serine protease n=1 Tax=Mucilaginibacter sp. TaxID=1882438 RepID=UPI002637DFDC|nr:rhomboid family intramembrane serine protease [Mucilaginibacter sp.]
MLRLSKHAGGAYQVIAEYTVYLLTNNLILKPMAWGISPRKVAVIPLCGYNASHYLTLIYHAFNNLGWRISYFDRDGIIAYTPISWESYAEEVSVRIVNNHAVIKSECVGYQFFFTDYGKNEKNLELLINGEIAYVEYHLQDNLEQTTQELIDSIPDNQFISLDNPPMGYKEKLRSFLSAFVPKKNYFITPLLVLTNIAIYIVTHVIMIVMMIVLFMKAAQHHGDPAQNLIRSMEDIYLSLGFSSRTQVLNGQVWRLITNTFLHFSIMHIAGNMIVLIYIGSLIESKLGKWNYLFLYLFTGICASITSVIWRDQGIAAGASGAIFGLFGVLLALLSTNFYENNARRALLISTVIFVAYNIIPIGNHVDHAAHFGGLITGYIFGWIAFLGLKYQKQSLTTIFALAITILCTSLCIQFAPVYDFKEMQKLSKQTENLSADLSRKFYGSYGMERGQRLDVFKNTVIPDVDTLNRIAKRMANISLPKKQKAIVAIKSKLITQECKLYTLLYLEFRDNDPVKYRKEINATTQKINDLRVDWTAMGDDSNE